MANYTIQTHSKSGSFACPDGRRGLTLCASKGDVEWHFDAWADQHSRIGSDEQDAYLLVWKGVYDDVTDLYPDFEVRYGPRMGIHWNPC